MAEKPPKKTEQTKKDEKQPAMPTLGRTGFEAYGAHPGPHGAWKTFDGRAIPSWTSLQAGKNDDGSPNTGGPLTCERWEVAAQAVIGADKARCQVLQDALKRETARADAADREAKEWQSLAGQMEKDLDALRAAPPTPAELPASGWSSERARELVRAVSVVDQPYLLGDLLELLAPHVGETGANEGAADTLRRVLKERAEHAFAHGVMSVALDEMTKSAERFKADAEKLQAAMVARRAPDADAELRMAALIQALGPASAVHQGLVVHALAARVVDEWRDLRDLLPKRPMVAVAVRDDSTKEIAERYSVGVLEWDGKAVKFDLLEGPARPWADLVRTMNHAVATRLVPPTFR